MKKTEGGMVIYPWQLWMKRKSPFTIRRGLDFECQPHSMATLIRMKASAVGRRVSIQINESVLTVHFKEEIDR